MTLPFAANVQRLVTKGHKAAEYPLRYLAVLQTVADGETRIRGISQRLILHRGVVCRAVAMLQREGLLKRKIDPEDKRDRLVSLTAKGRYFLNGLEP